MILVLLVKHQIRWSWLRFGDPGLILSPYFFDLRHHKIILRIRFLKLLEALRHVIAFLLDHLFFDEIIRTYHISHSLLLAYITAWASNSRPLQIVVEVLLNCQELVEILVDSVDRLKRVIYILVHFVAKIVKFGIWLRYIFFLIFLILRNFKILHSLRRNVLGKKYWVETILIFGLPKPWGRALLISHDNPLDRLWRASNFVYTLWLTLIHFIYLELYIIL